MIGSRLEAPVRAEGLELTVVAAAPLQIELFQQAGVRLVVIDLADRAFPTAQTLSEIRRLVPKAPIVGFHPHVDPEIGTRAAAAGCDVVMPRSRFFTDVAAAIRAGLEAADKKRERVRPGEKP